MSRSLYNTYRPQTFDEVIGNESTVSSLQKMFEREEGLPNAILLHGPSGTGKTTIARIIKNVLNIADQDYKELDLASTRGIDNIRDLREKSKYKPLRSKYRMYLMDEVHQVTSQAQEAMLKWLEDAPKHVIIVLATTDPQKLIKTILTRCNKFQMNLLSREEMRVLVEWVLDNEEITLPKKVVSEIIKKSEGSPRNALTLLDNVIEMDDEEAAMEILEGGTGEGSKETIDLCRLLMDGRATWKQYQSLLGAIKEEPESVRYSVLGFLNAVVLREKDEKKIKRAIAVMECFDRNYYDTKKSGLIYSCFGAYHGIDV